LGQRFYLGLLHLHDRRLFGNCHNWSFSRKWIQHIRATWKNFPFTLHVWLCSFTIPLHRRLSISIASQWIHKDVNHFHFLWTRYVHRCFLDAL
jgi:hypothetical protein